MLVLDHIWAGYGETLVLRDVSLTVAAGQTVALLGPNGAGKTTLLRVASGLLRPEQGRVDIDGTDMTGRAPNRLAQVGVCHVPEGRGVFGSLTVKENLLLQLSGGKSGTERAVDAFPVLGQRLSQLAGTLSGGEQQMLALARAYISNPRIMLLDEVSMGLAPKVVDEIFGFLERMSAEGAALLLVEQYVTRALALADSVYLLGRGEVVHHGDPAGLDGDELFARYLGHTV